MQTIFERNSRYLLTFLEKFVTGATNALRNSNSRCSLHLLNNRVTYFTLTLLSFISLGNLSNHSYVRSWKLIDIRLYYTIIFFCIGSWSSEGQDWELLECYSKFWSFTMNQSFLCLTSTLIGQSRPIASTIFSAFYILCLLRYIWRRIFRKRNFCEVLFCFLLTTCGAVSFVKGTKGKKEHRPVTAVGEMYLEKDERKMDKHTFTCERKFKKRKLKYRAREFHLESLFDSWKITRRLFDGLRIR